MLDNISWEDVGKLLTFIMTLGLPIIGGLYKTVVKPFRKKMQDIDNLSVMVPELYLKVEQILKEVTPNGGSSLKDIVTGLSCESVGNKQRLRAFLRKDEDPIFEVDACGKLVWANDAYLALCGRQLSDIVGNGWLNTIEMSDRDEVHEEMQCAIEQDRDFEMEYTIVHALGQRHLVRSQASILRDHTGKPTGINGILRVDNGNSPLGS